MRTWFVIGVFFFGLGCRSALAQKNVGTEVWLVPAPAGDLIQALQNPELWERAQGRVDVVGLYSVQTYHHDGFVCGKPCGPNTYPALMQAVPGGAIKWLSDRFRLAMEAAAVKEHSCTSKTLREATTPVLRSIELIQGSGGTLTYLAVDESFASGLTKGPLFPGVRGCGLSPAEVAQLLKQYVEDIHRVSPETKVGFIEPYPGFNADELMSFMLELERIGVPVPFFHLDMHLQSVVRERNDLYRDLGRLKGFCEARNIPFGIIIWGENGSSNRAFATDAWATLQVIKRAVGVTTITKFQSWAEDPPGDITSLKWRPGTVTDDAGRLVGEADPLTHTGQLLQQLEFLGVRPTQP